MALIEKLPPELLRLHKGISFTGITTVFLCHDGKGNIFLTKRSQNCRDEQGRWEPGGGGLKHGTSVKDNLHRELIEEYNVESLETEFLGYRDAFRKTLDGQPTHWLGLDFAVLINPNLVKINEPDMIDDSGWFTLDTLPGPMHSQFDEFMRLHGTRIKEILAVH